MLHSDTDFTLNILPDINCQDKILAMPEAL